MYFVVHRFLPSCFEYPTRFEDNLVAYFVDLLIHDQLYIVRLTGRVGEGEGHYRYSYWPELALLMTIRLFHLGIGIGTCLRLRQRTKQEAKCARTEITESITMQCNLHSPLKVSLKQGRLGPTVLYRIT